MVVTLQDSARYVFTYVPINGMPHLAYPGADVGEIGGGFAVKIFPEGLVLSWDCPNLLELHNYIFTFVALNVCGKFIVNSTDIHISLSHTVHDRQI